MQTVSRAALCAAVLLCAAPAQAQGQCKPFVDGLAARNKAVADATDAVKKLRPSPRACTKARKLLDVARQLEKQIDSGGAACAGLPENDFARMKLRFEKASAGFNAEIADSEGGRLCG